MRIIENCSSPPHMSEPKNESCEFKRSCVVKLSRRVTFTPGTGIVAIILYTTTIASVKRIFFLICSVAQTFFRCGILEKKREKSNEKMNRIKNKTSANML